MASHGLQNRGIIPVDYRDVTAEALEGDSGPEDNRLCLPGAFKSVVSVHGARVVQPIPRAQASSSRRYAVYE